MLEEDALDDLLDDPKLLVVEAVGGLQLELSLPVDEWGYALYKGAASADSSTLRPVRRPGDARVL